MNGESGKGRFGVALLLLCIAVTTHTFAYYVGRLEGRNDKQLEINAHPAPGYEESQQRLEDAAAERNRKASAASRPDKP